MSEDRFAPTHAPLLRAASLAATAAALVLGTGIAHAQTVYLVGADFYSSASDGTDNGPNTYLYDTNSSSVGTEPFELTLNGVTYGKGIAIPLAAGANSFTFGPAAGGADPGPYAGIGLYFDTTSVSYNPGSGARTPDLSFSSSVGPGFTGDFTPAAGTQVASYNFGFTSPANGSTSISEGTPTVSVSNYTTDSAATGSFVVNVSGAASAPEPTALLLLAPGALGLIAARRRRAG
jgi:hypothetical protein